MKARLLHLGITLIISIAALIGHGVWYAAVASKSVSVANLESQIVSKTESMSRIASARMALIEVADDENVVRSYFVPETSVVTFIDGLEKEGKSHGATVKVLSVSSERAGSVPTLEFALAISGTFDAVMRTVGSIEYAPYDLSISELSLAHEEKSDWQANLKLIVGSVQTATSTP